jgi:hypothetical protein
MKYKQLGMGPIANGAVRVSACFGVWDMEAGYLDPGGMSPVSGFPFGLEEGDRAMEGGRWRQGSE